MSLPTEREVEVLEYVFRPMRLRPMWPMYGTYIATLLGLALINRESISNKKYYISYFD
jgi:hypothetical protein